MPTSPADVAHLMRRAGFGASLGEIRTLAKLDLAPLVDHVLDLGTATPPTPPESLGKPGVEGWTQFVDLMTWWFERMRTNPAGLQEKMTLLWHGHFCTQQSKIFDPQLLHDQNALFRANAIGSFRDLTQKMAIDPAMLLYLDNAANSVGYINENFARELMELFLLGVDQYTQLDVVAAARAWTGYTVDDNRRYLYDPTRHDGRLKTFFGITQKWTGPQIIDEILTGQKKEIAARFIVGKLWSWLAAPNPSEATLSALVQVFLSSNLSVKALLRVIFLHPDFYSPAVRTGLVRTPIEWLVAVMKGMGLPASEAQPQWYMEQMGQAIFEPPNVSGWRQNGYWLSASAFWRKADFAWDMCWTTTGRTVLADVGTLTPKAAVQRALDTFSLVEVSSTTRRRLERLVADERAAGGWALRPNLIVATVLSPEMQLA